MLKMRAFTLNDLTEVLALHNKYFGHLEFPPFGDCLNAFIIEDEKEEIVLAGAAEKVAEAMLVTNKAKSEIKLGKSLVMAQHYLEYTCQINQIRDMYAFVDREIYAKHLIKHGFIESDRALKLRIP